MERIRIIPTMAEAKSSHHTLTYQLSVLGLVTLMTAEICFYTSKTMNLYWLLTLFSLSVAFLSFIRTFNGKLRINNCIIWLTAVYSMYMFYGFFFLRRGVFSWEILFFRYIEGITLYVLLGNVLRVKDDGFITPFVLSGIIALFYLVLNEGNLFFGGMRIGNSLSGNVNTVGYNFGIISTLIMWYYCKTKKKPLLLLFAIFSLMMVFTGSKKTILILIIDIILLSFYQKGKGRKWIKGLLLLSIGFYVVFNVEVFYNAIGSRIESQIQTMIYGRASLHYSYSTETRNEMLLEAFGLFLRKPILSV